MLVHGGDEPRFESELGQASPELVGDCGQWGRIFRHGAPTPHSFGLTGETATIAGLD
jgi:hypothetical protein